MRTTSIDDANLAEIADLLADIETTNQDLKSKIYRDSSPSVSWIPLFAIASVAASFGFFAGAVLSRSLL